MLYCVPQNLNERLENLCVRLNKQTKKLSFKFHYLLKKQNLNWLTLHNTHMHVKDRKKASHPTFSLKTKKKKANITCSLLVYLLQAWNSSATTKEQSVQLVLLYQCALSHLWEARDWVHTHLNISYKTIIILFLCLNLFGLFNFIKIAS